MGGILKTASAMPFIRRVDEDIWFALNQRLLLRMAASGEGRNLLDLPRGLGRVVRIKKNEICELLAPAPVAGGRPRAVFRSHYFSRAPIADTIRSRWDGFVGLAEDIAARDMLALPNLFTRTGVCVMAGGRRLFDTLTAYPDPNPETSTVDGYVRVFYSQGAGKDWATLKADAGNSYNDSGNNAIIGFTTDNSPNFRIISRMGALFNTSSMGAEAVPLSGTISLYGNYKTNQYAGWTPKLNIYAFAPSSNTALANGDFGAFGSTPLSSDLAYASYQVNAYNDFALNDLSVIITDGITKLGARESYYDAGSNTPVHSGVANTDSNFQPWCAEKGGSYRPKLVVVYTAPISGGQFTLSTKYY